MSKLRKHLCLILSALVLSSVFLISCSDNSQTETDEKQSDTEQNSNTAADESESETEEERLKPNIPDSADFGGDEIRFLYWTHSLWANTVRESRDIVSEGINGEGINDAVFNRNVKIEDAYKVKIALEKMDSSQLPNAVQKNVKAGDPIYDCVVPVGSSLSTFVSQGLLHNFYDIPNIDLDMPWWDIDAKNSLTVNGYLPITTGSLLINDKDGTAAVAFNKTLVENHGMEDLYTAVREGRWTYDKLSELAEIAAEDTNGDGKMTVDDVYGFLGGRDVMESFWYGCGSQFSSKTDDGGFEFTFGSERDVSAAQYIIEMMNQTWFLNHHLISNVDDTYYRQLFEQGHGLFFWMRLDDVTNMRAGEAEFGILPTPKYEVEQDKYYSMVSRHTCGLLGVPISSSGEQLSEIGLILEAMAAESHYTLIPEYIESNLKTKYARDTESSDMVDIIINSRVFDAIYIYNIGGFSDSFLVLGDSANTNIASFLKTREKIITKNMDKFLSYFEKSE